MVILSRVLCVYICIAADVSVDEKGRGIDDESECAIEKDERDVEGYDDENVLLSERKIDFVNSLYYSHLWL